MAFWAEILQSFRDSTEKKKAKDQQSAATLALMYLALGMDYPYNMATNFKSALGDGNEGFSLLKYPGKMASLLKIMKEKELILDEPDKVISRRPRNLYKINPEILQSPSYGGSTLIHPELISVFLEWLEVSYKSKDKRMEFIKEWSTIRLFDFITFLNFLKKEAIKWESSSELRELINYLKELTNIWNH